jgi:hypothetical protein
VSSVSTPVVVSERRSNRLECSHCGTIYDVSRFPIGHAFECVCGRDLEIGAAPATSEADADLQPTAERRLFIGLPFVSLLLIQGGPGEDAEACAACGTCGLGFGMLLLIPIAILALNIVLLIWVARDAKARGMDNAVLWMILVMVTSVVGLIIYLFSRPKGNLIPCPSCGNKRLQASAKCPHCGNP